MATPEMDGWVERDREKMIGDIEMHTGHRCLGELSVHNSNLFLRI